MIRTVTVCTGDDPYAKTAQQSALTVAQLFEARLRAVMAWEPEEAQRIAQAEDLPDPATLAEQVLEAFVKEAQAIGMTAETRLRGEGVHEGLLAEARECDLLVIALPTGGIASNAPLARAILHEDLPILRKAECSLLAVCHPLGAMKRILAVYQGGTEGKAALRLAGHLAERAEADLTVLSVKGDLQRAAELTAVAAEYLKGFSIPPADTVQRTGRADTDGDAVALAAEIDADAIVLGDEPYGLLARFFGSATAEQVKLATHVPVFVAR